MRLFRRLPDFIIIGAQKAGTSSIHKYLNLHPQIAMSKRKEIHFFDTFLPDKVGALSKYKRNFPIRLQWKNKVIAGETTPYYLFHPHVPQRIKKYIPDSKFIVLLRNPIDRAFSLYNAHIRSGAEVGLSFEEAIAIESKRISEDRRRIYKDEFYVAKNLQMYSYLTRGKYYEQINNWLKYFDKNNFLFIESDLFFKETENVLSKIFSFLNVKNIKINKSNIKIENKGEYSNVMDKNTRLMLQDYFRESNLKLYELIGQTYDW